MPESLRVQRLFNKLYLQPQIGFPLLGGKLAAPKRHGVYIIRKGKTVLHVGRTVRGQAGLFRRITNHLHGVSSFTIKYFSGDGSRLRENGYTYQCLEVEDLRLRALLECYAIGVLCPKHIGLGAVGDV